MAITVTLKGVDITGYVDYRSIAITDTQEVTGDTMNMHIYSYICMCYEYLRANLYMLLIFTHIYAHQCICLT